MTSAPDISSALHTEGLAQLNVSSIQTSELTLTEILRTLRVCLFLTIPSFWPRVSALVHGCCDAASSQHENNSRIYYSFHSTTPEGRVCL